MGKMLNLDELNYGKIVGIRVKEEMMVSGVLEVPIWERDDDGYVMREEKRLFLHPGNEKKYDGKVVGVIGDVVKLDVPGIGIILLRWIDVFFEALPLIRRLIVLIKGMFDKEWGFEVDQAIAYKVGAMNMGMDIDREVVSNMSIGDEVVEIYGDKIPDIEWDCERPKWAGPEDPVGVISPELSEKAKRAIFGRSV
jgi:hypothetical protein